MLETGALALADLQREIDLGYFRPSLVRELTEAPHAEGWNADAAARYDAYDRDAGFEKHAEVYRRKRLRTEAIRRHERSVGASAA